MDVFKQNKILIWIIIILVVINLGTIAGMWVMHLGRKPHHEILIHQSPHLPDRKSPGIGRFEMLGTELQFDEEQMSKFNEFRSGHQNEMKNLVEKINEKKKQILSEISVPESDTEKVGILFSEIGQYQTSIEKEIFNHFRKIKMICNDEQKQKLEKILKDISEPKIPPHPVPPPDKR
ncbi:MAG: periplasmic heavy metal sensor [Ignavibacteria bacterium]|nr:periplasmic heavy metal sensor [Ignavibacteria bacterium]